MNVKRYDTSGFEHEYGVYVRWVDYDAADVERHSLTIAHEITYGALERSRERIAQLEAELSKAKLQAWGGVENAAERIAAGEDRIAQLEAALRQIASVPCQTWEIWCCKCVPQARCVTCVARSALADSKDAETRRGTND